MQNFILKSKNETLKLIESKKEVYFFGSGVVAEKTLSNLDATRKISGIFDNSKTLWNTKDKKISIFNPNKIKKIKKNNFLIIIATTSFSDVYYQLKQDFKLRPGIDFVISFILNDLISIEKIQNLKKEILFTSGSPKSLKSDMGGGLYKIELNKEKWTTKKVYSGNCYGLVNKDEYIYLVDTDEGIIKLNKDYKIIKKYKIEKGLRAHGLSYCPKSKKFVIASSYKDKIIVYSENFKKLSEHKISHKFNEDNTPQHHCNDCEIIENHVYISMFSLTGNWKKDSFDGGILEINIKKDIKQKVITDLWMPHNVKNINGTLHVLDSLKGNLLFNNFTVQGTFPAFTRGLYYDSGFYYIGQSRNRNFSKFIGLSKNISVDTGVVIFDPELKISRFIQVSNKISEIHSVLAL